MAAPSAKQRVAFVGFSVAESNRLKSHLQNFNAQPDYIVSATTSVVVVPSAQPLDGSNSKITQAQRYNIPIVTEDYILQCSQVGIALPTESFHRASLDAKPAVSAEALNDSFFHGMNTKRDFDIIPAHTNDLQQSESKKPKLLDPAQKRPRPTTAQSGGKWTTARVFISSTFKDMHGERDYLTRYVFPELQERCDRLRVHLHPVDLRWGVTEEDTSNALEICLSEVDSCRPFFLGLLSERYGWRPEKYVVPDEPRFDWIKAMPPGLSITHLEMYYGVLRDLPNMAGKSSLSGPSSPGYAFCLRDPDFMRDVPAQFQEDFRTESVEHRYNLERLREDIRTKCDPANVFDQYPCNWAGLVDGGKPSVTALDKFGAFVLETLWRHIESHFSSASSSRTDENSSEVQEIDEEREMHEQFAESHSRNFVGRQNLINQLVEFCDSPATSSPNSGKLLVVLGEPGAGKTSLMSYFANRYSNSSSTTNKDVIFHFVGAAPGSTNVRAMVARLSREITLRRGAGAESEEDLPEEWKDLKVHFGKLIREFGTLKDRRLVLILDALNQLEDSYQAHSLDWLPDEEEIPENVRIVVSTLRGSVFDSLERRKNKYQLLQVGGLNRAECVEIVEKTLLEFRKKLTPSQMDLLLRKQDASKPLYLVVACEELRVFGVFERLTDRIRSMAETVPALFSEVLERLELDHGVDLVKMTMSFIACSKGGLVEEEILALLGNSDSGDSLPQSVWSRLYRSLKAYVRPSGDIVDFFHQQLPKAVKKRYFFDGNSEFFKKVHEKLGNYFEKCADPELDHSWNGSHKRGLAFVAYHYTMSEQWERLIFSLCNLAFIEAKCAAGMTYDLVSDYLLVTNREDKNFLQFPEIEEYQRFVMQRSHVLAHHSDLCFSMAASLPNTSRPAEEAQARYKSRLETRPWMKWLNKPQTANPCIMTLNGHDMVVRCSAYSPQGNLIASAADDSKIKLWNATTGEETKTLLGHKQSITCMEFSPDGEYLATGSYDRSIRVWSVNSGDEVVSLRGHKGQVASLVWGPDSRTLYSGGQDRIIRVWKPFSSTNSSSSFDDSDDSPSSSACVKTFEGHHNRPVRCVAISPSGRLLASSGEDNTIFIWDLFSNSMTPRELTGHVKACNWLSFFDESKLASCSDDRSVRVWNVDTCTETTCYTAHHDGVCSVVWGPSGETLLSASHDNVICLYDLKENKPKSILIGHTGSVFRASFSPDFKNIVSSSFDRSVKVWAVMDKVEIHGHDARILSIAFSPSGRLLATGSRDKTAKIWDVATGRELRTLVGHTSNVFGVGFSPDGENLATASRDMTIRLWNVHSGECWAILRGHTAIVRSVDWHPNGRQLASCGDDKKMLIWDAERLLAQKQSGAMLDVPFENSLFGLSSQFGHHKTVSRVKFSPDGRRCASTSDDTSAKIWDTKVDTVPARAFVKVATLTGHKKPVNSCGFSPDNSRIVTASDDKTVRCWSAKNARMIAELKKHTEAVTDVTYTADGWIFSGSTDATVVLWDSLTFQPAVSFACLSRVCAVAASPQGHIFAAGDGSGMLMLLSPVDLPKSSAEIQQQQAQQAAANGSANSTAFSQQTL